MSVLPTVGRIVYYKSPASKDGTFPQTDRAAIITEVHEPSPNHDEVLVKLCVFHPFGLQFTDWQKQGSEDGCWDWMPFQKDQAARLAPGTMNESHPMPLAGAPMATGASSEPGADLTDEGRAAAAA